MKTPSGQPECIWPLAAELGEGPLWWNGALWFTDIKQDRIHRFDPATGQGKSWEAPAAPGFLAPLRDGGFLVGAKLGLFRFDPDSDNLRFLEAVEPDRLGNRLNDGAVDPKGRLWFGSMDDAEKDSSGVLYEIFTKAPPLSSVGSGAEIGIRSDSSWNNPEPEIVLVVNRQGEAVGASLGNDVNLRDFEGRSALLLGKAKDNNACCSIGPFIRLFDADFTMDQVRNAVVELTIEGEDNYRLEGKSSMAEISRDPLDLVHQALGQHHYPDGFVLFLGTMFAPIQDRDTPGLGFTHKTGDLVRVSAPSLGVLENKVTTCKQAPPWDFGIADLMTNLARRGLLNS